jgi:hypothetical protein
MTVDERLEFLLKSTESLHTTLHESIKRNDREHERLERIFSERFERLLGVVEVIAEATRNHEGRISGLESRQ